MIPIKIQIHKEINFQNVLKVFIGLNTTAFYRNSSRDILILLQISFRNITTQAK